ncbi:hypothetical protein [Mesorhizobium sp. B2-6-3]|uniref:hypothetical protein n=1 Tax=Mesorhizobium sp. B2-6-3 TaxID=2589914 RepID=UPI0015E2EFE2|nr:hypothetical protein [Mesorhizobium sp. B2-6-3]
MFGLNWLSVGAGAVAAAVVTFGVMATYSELVTVPAVKAETRTLVQAEARQRALDLIQKRNDDNAEITTFDAAQLCVELGGVWVQPDRCD